MSDPRKISPIVVYKPLLSGILFPLLLLLTNNAVSGSDEPRTEKQSLDFDRQVAPIIASRCLGCHGADAPEAQLRMDTKEGLLRGGDSGPALLPGSTADSLLLQRVLQDEMPPKKPLPEAEKQLLKQWIAEGAHWGTATIVPFRFSSEATAGLDWWSLQPLA